MSDTVTLERKSRFDFTPDTLPEHPLFNGLPAEFRKILAECGMRTDFDDGATVVDAGEPANGFYLVTRGSIDLETAGVRYPNRVQTIGTGGVLGWSWMFPPYYWHFNAVASEPVETIFFYGTYLRQLCDRNHDFGYEVVKRLSRMLVTSLQTGRQRWIDTAQTSNGGSDIPYLVI